MRYRRLEAETLDYVFGGSERDFYRDVPGAVGQAAQTRLLLFLGEWYLNIEDGTPYLQGILGKHSLETANAVLRDRIQTTQGIVNIQEFDSEIDPDTRFLNVSALVNTIYGVTDVQILNYTDL